MIEKAQLLGTWGVQCLETRSAMNNSKVVIFLGCLFAATLTAPLVTAAAHGGGHGGGFSGGHSFAGRPGMGMPGRPGMGMPSRPGMGFRRFGDRDFDRDDRFRRFNRFNDGDFDRDDRFHRFNHFNHFNDFIFIGDFGFPWWWGWGWGPWWGWGGGYPYGYYGGYNYGGYGSGYGYGDSSGSRVAELQRRLARAGYYHGAIDGIMGPATRRAIRAYERDSGYEG
jgi:putative peptidoglycan binding protein